MKPLCGPGVCAALVVAQLLCAPCVSAQAPAPSAVHSEAAKQSEIYQSRGGNVPEGYVIDRSLLSYTFVLPAEFRLTLASLGPLDRWLDVGAGEGRAVLDYETSRYDAMLPGHHGKKAQAVAMSIEDRRTPRWYEVATELEPGQIRYLFGRRFREYSPDEIGRFQLITDVVGAFSYTRYLATFMTSVLRSLEVEGTFYTVLQDVHSETGSNRPYYPGASYLTEIAKPDGSELRICAWLKSISCVEVTCELKPNFPPPIEVYRVRKTCEAATVPPLELVRFQAGTPPERRFRLTGSAQP